MRKLVAGALVALLLGACSSSSDNVKQPEDEFLDEVESVCRDAGAEIHKLTAGAADAPDDLLEIVSDAADRLSELTPPRELSRSWDRYTTKVDEQVASLGDVVAALAVADQPGAQAALLDLNTKSNDADLIINTVGAIRCRGLMPFNALTSEELGTGITVPTIPSTDVTTAPTQATTVETAVDPETSVAPETTDTPITPLPIDTFPATTAATATTVSTATGGVIAGDASLEFQPIAGYTWGAFGDVPGTITPTDDPILGPLLDGYYVGVMENTTDGSSVYVYLTVLNQDSEWTPDQLTAYYNFELVGDGGVDQITPGLFLPARVKTNVVDGGDGAVFTIPGFGVSLLASTGADMLALLDGFATAQSIGS